MHKTLFVFLISTLVLSGCSTIRDSRANPFNWFGGTEEVAAGDVAATGDGRPGEANPLIPETSGLLQSREERNQYRGTPIDAIAEVTLERVPGGVMIRATGLAATQGIYEARLTPENDDESPVDGVLSYRLEVLNNPYVRAQGPAATRQVTVARTLTDQELADTRIIRVKGVQNALETRRR